MQAVCLIASRRLHVAVDLQDCSIITLFKQLLQDFSMCIPQTCFCPGTVPHKFPTLLRHQHMMTAAILHPGQMNM